MKFDRRMRGRGSTANALRALIHAEMAHERAAAEDKARAAELEAQVREAREQYRRLTAANA
ncbi:hypothetical protein [uncultured Jatrophihabitans sp.]|uniref:hypothetical protein n=1 Tax=uncultured Jatrophihabitans sp. TaxID=1610747 RepID=UPI0035C98A4D